MNLHRHKEIVEFFLTVLNQGVNSDFSKWEEIIHNDYSPGEIPEKITQNKRPGREEFKQRIMHVNRGIPDLKYIITSIIAENDEVMVHHDIYATNMGGLWNLPPSDVKSKIEGFHRFKFKDEKIIKIWFVFDTFKIFSDWGAAVFEKNDLNEMKFYIKKLKDIGMIPDKVDINSVGNI